MRVDDKKIAEFVADLRSAYERVCENSNLRYIKKCELIHLAILEEAKSFYVSEEEGMRVISTMNQGKPLNRKNLLTAMKYHDLFEVYKSLKKDLPYLPDSLVVKLAIEHPAPRFYIQPETAAKTLNKYIRL